MVIKGIERNLQDVCEFHKKHVHKRREQRSESGASNPPVDLLDCYLDLLDENNDETITKVFAGVTSQEDIGESYIHRLPTKFVN